MVNNKMDVTEKTFFAFWITLSVVGMGSWAIIVGNPELDIFETYRHPIFLISVISLFLGIFETLNKL